MQAAKMAEEKKHQVALDKAAQHVGETKWVLSFKDPLEGKRQDSMNVRQAGFAEIDADDESEDEEDTRPIRVQFGGGVKKKAEVCTTGFLESHLC
jgi:Fe-S cluster assembly ATPase SufC